MGCWGGGRGGRGGGGVGGGGVLIKKQTGSQENSQRSLNSEGEHLLGGIPNSTISGERRTAGVGEAASSRKWQTGILM